MKKVIKNLPASIQAKLHRYAKETDRPFIDVFYSYAIERFLSRLSHSQYCKNFILKGGLAFWGWGINLRRPTRDIDFDAYVSNTIDDMERIVKEICRISVEDDGIIFDAASIESATIMTAADYEGVRLRFKAYLGKAYVWMQVDISFANVITPKEISIEYPTILNMPTFELRGYNQETTIAEKLQAMVFLGNFDDRLKDFYDIYLLSKECDFDGAVLVKAIDATFKNRKTAIPSDVPAALSVDFALLKKDDWLRFMNKINNEESELSEFEGVIAGLRKFLLSPILAAAREQDFNSSWRANKGWTNELKL